jgi:hypothetical protein
MAILSGLVVFPSMALFRLEEYTSEATPEVLEVLYVDATLRAISNKKKKPIVCRGAKYWCTTNL